MSRARHKHRRSPEPTKPWPRDRVVVPHLLLAGRSFNARNAHSSRATYPRISGVQKQRFFDNSGTIGLPRHWVIKVTSEVRRTLQDSVSDSPLFRLFDTVTSPHGLWIMPNSSIGSGVSCLISRHRSHDTSMKKNDFCRFVLHAPAHSPLCWLAALGRTRICAFFTKGPPDFGDITCFVTGDVCREDI